MRKGNKISCFYINTRSIRNKFVELKSYVSLGKPDMIFITEIWVKISVHIKFNQSYILNDYYLEGNILFRYERKGAY